MCLIGDQMWRTRCTVETTSARPPEGQLVQQLFGWILTNEMAQQIVGDKAYDSDKLDEGLFEAVVELIAKDCRSRKPENKT